jgi:hypothetical protein
MRSIASATSLFFSGAYKFRTVLEIASFHGFYQSGSRDSTRLVCFSSHIRTRSSHRPSFFHQTEIDLDGSSYRSKLMCAVIPGQPPLLPFVEVIPGHSVLPTPRCRPYPLKATNQRSCNSGQSKFRDANTDIRSLTKLPSLLDNTLITVIVEHAGIEATGHLHKQLLWHKVPNIHLESVQGPMPMETSFKPVMSSNIPQVWCVRDCSQAVFRMFVAWLYGGNNTLPAIDEDHTVARYFRLYRLCTEFQADRILRDEIIKRLYLHFTRPGHGKDLTIIGEVYRYTSPDDKLRDMISGFLGATVLSGRLVETFREDGTKELMEMMDRNSAIRRDVMNWIFNFNVGNRDFQDEAISQIGDSEAQPWRKFCQGQ